MTKARAATALTIAIAADLLQLPLTLGFVASLASVVGIAADVPLEGIDLGIDLVAAAATTFLLGFHWALLPTVFLEAVPIVDAMPTWTGCVLYVIWDRRRKTTALQRTA